MFIREIRLSYGNAVEVPGASDSSTVRKGRDIARLMTPILESEAVEVCYVLCLTTKLEVIGYHQVSRGSLNEASMHPREVYMAAVLSNAAGVLLVHNHPSGDPTPSGQDLEVTHRIKKAGELLGIELLDHVIIGHNGRFVSLKELGEM